MPSTNQETIRIPDWVPDAARLRVVELQALPWLDEAERKLLDRLATYDTMKTGVWEKLPSEAKGFEGSIIDWAWFAFVFFRRRPRPYPKTKSKAKWDEWRKHLPRQTLPDFRHTGNLLRIVLNQIIQHYGDAQAYWQRFWEGDKNLTKFNATPRSIGIATGLSMMKRRNKYSTT